MGPLRKRKIITKRRVINQKKIKSQKMIQECTKLDPYCRFCGDSNDVSAHHIKFRSEGGDDSLANLVNLCFSCHRIAHDGLWTTKSEKAEFFSPAKFVLINLKNMADSRYDEAIKWLESKK